jgi:fructokinase
VVPVIVEHVTRSSAEGTVRHWFTSECAFWENKLPRFSRPSDRLLDLTVQRAARTDVFFADRLSAAIIEAAASARQHGAMVMYEPSTDTDRTWMAAMLDIAHVVKFSADYSKELALCPRQGALWVETLGAEGLRWTVDGISGWRILGAPFAQRDVDTCGAGDWFTAGLLFALFELTQNPRSATGAEIEQALHCGALLAAWSCGFLGARGALYDAGSSEAISLLAAATSLRHAPSRGRSPVPRPAVPSNICGSCLVQTT